MALKIKLKLGGGGGGGGSNGAPADASSSSSSIRPATPASSIPGLEGAPSVQRPKIKLVRSEAKANNGQPAELGGVAAGSSSNGDRPAKPPKTATSATVVEAAPPASTPRIVLKARPTPASLSEASPAPTKASDGPAGLPPFARKEHKPVPKPSFVVKPPPVVIKPPKKKKAPSASAPPTVKDERGSTPLASAEMPPPALPALARVKAEPSPAAFPPSPLGTSSPLPSTTPGTPQLDDGNPAPDDNIIQDPTLPLPPAGPPGPKVPALGASAASGKKLVGGRLQQPFIDVLEKMLKELKRRDAYGFFLKPVSDADAPGYSAIISQPMDFTTMDRKAHSGDYKSFDEFEVDARLVFANCLAFNEPESIFGLMATKLGRWTENHLMFYRELVIPGTEADHVQPPTPATTDMDDSRATSQAGSPSRSRSVSMALSGDDEGAAAGSSRGGGQPPIKPKRTGNGQLGKKRGPYRKGVQVQVAKYFAPAAQTAPLASNQFVIAQAQGGWVDENGRLRGAGAGLYALEFQNIVRWWEAGGKRAKTKKELSKIATRRARDEFGPIVAADGSRDLREDETLDDVLDALLDAVPEPPTIESLPPDFLAGSLGRIYATATAKGQEPDLLYSPPAKPAALPEATYGNHFFGDRLPEAFTWARSDAGMRPSSPPPAPPPAPRVRPRTAAPHDYGVYPFFTPASISPAGLYDNERRDFLAAPVPEPRRPASFFSDPLLDSGGSSTAGSGSVATDVEARLDAARSLAAYDDPLRKAVYGGWVGEIYADSLETFLTDAYGEGKPSAQPARGTKAREWVERNVYDQMFALEGALPLARKTAAVIQQAGGLAALDARWEAEECDDGDDNDNDNKTTAPLIKAEPSSPSRLVKHEAEDSNVVMSAADDVEMTAKAGPPALLNITPHGLAASLPSEAAIWAMIRRMPVDRAAKAHLDRLGQLPIFLSSVISSPADFYAEPEPATPTLTGKRRRSVVEREAAEEPDAGVEPESWAAATLQTVGRELLDLIHEQAGYDEAPRKKTRTSRGGDDSGRWVSESKATRVRLLLLSLARRVPLPLLETLDPDQVELLFPDGPIRRCFSQLSRSS